jgi:hypothetical protein
MHSIWLVIGILAAAIAAGLAIVVRTRWLQSHTLAKCVLLSVGLHLLLAVACGLLAGFMPASWGQNDEGRMTMVMVVAAEDEEGGDPLESPVLPSESTAATNLAASALHDVSRMAQETPADVPSAEGVPDDVVRLLEPAVEEASPAPTDVKPEHVVPAAYADRGSARRAAAAVARGGSEATEQAVRRALVWLATNQSADGRWEVARHGGGRGYSGPHRNQATGVGCDHGVTGLALLAFLGAGTTHADGPHADCVAKGIRFLVDRQRADGSLAGDAEFFAALYCHGMAGIALAECAAMTGDPALQGPLERAVGYTLAMQHPTTGGWRYAAGDKGDTSQLGWQVMLLEAAAQAGLDSRPGSGIDQARQRVRRFLQSVSSGRAGGLAAYRAGERPTMPMTAEALFCRMLLGAAPDHPSVNEAVAVIAGSPPDSSQPNVYAWYYATAASFHAGGPQWQIWNSRLQAAVLTLQRKDGGSLEGSWDPDPVWGGHGGRVYATAMAALTLEVYYRYAPLHGEAMQVAKNR